MSDAGFKLSVLIPARNASATIGPTLASLARVADLIGEIVLVDDGSTDDTAVVARITAAEHNLPLNILPGAAAGVSVARNAALEAARFPLIYFLDADDLVINDGVRALVAALAKNPGIDLAVGDAIDNEQGVRRPHKVTPFATDPIRNAEDYITYRRPLFRPGSVIGRKTVLAQTHFPVGLPYQEDGIYWTKALTLSKAAAVNVDTIEYLSDEVRAAKRLAENHRQKFVFLCRHLRQLKAFRISSSAIRTSCGLNALTLSRKVIASGDYPAADRYLRYAWAANSEPAYRYKILKAKLRLFLAKTF